MLAVLFSLSMVAAPARASDGDLAAKQAQLERLREDMRAVAEDLKEDRSRQSGLESELREAEQRIGALAQEIDKLDASIEAQQARLADTRTRIQQTRQHMAAHQEALAAQIRAAYVMGRQERLKLLLSQQDPAAVGRMLTYYDYFNRARGTVIHAMRERTAALAELRTALERQTGRLTDLKSERGQSLQALRSANAERSRALQRLAGRIESDSEQLEALRADERALEQLMEQLRKALAETPPPPVSAPSGPFPSLEGELPWPLEGDLLASFGDPKQDPRLRWEGIWISGQSGKPVRTVASGRVVYVGWMHRYGLLVIVAHGGDYYTLYGHNGTALTQVGDSVATGEAIARAGNSGGHPKSGVYFEIRKGKTPLNPLAWLGSRP